MADQPPQITYAIQDFDTSGAMRAPYQILKGFVRANWKTKILATASSLNEHLDCVWDSVPVERVPAAFRLAKLVRIAARLFLRERSEVVISFIWDWHCFALALANLLWHKPYVLALDTYIYQAPTDNASWFARLWNQMRYGWVIHHANLILAEAPPSYEHAKRAFPQNDIMLVPFSLWRHELASVEAEWARQAFAPPRAPIILYAGRFIPRKNIPDLIQAFSQLAAEFPEWQLELRMLGGDASEIARVRELIQTKQLETRIMILPALTGAALYRRYRETSIVVLPSSGEGFPTAITEAMYFGGAIAAGSSGFVPYQLQYGNCGLVYPPNDVATLTTHLRTLMSNPGARAYYMEQARRRMTHLFTWENYFPALESKFRAVAERAQ